jgi:hypothetical protein
MRPASGGNRVVKGFYREDRKRRVVVIERPDGLYGFCEEMRADFRDCAFRCCSERDRVREWSRFAPQPSHESHASCLIRARCPLVATLFGQQNGALIIART